MACLFLVHRLKPGISDLGIIKDTPLGIFGGCWEVLSVILRGILLKVNRWYYMGYDVIGIFRALLKDLFLGKREGASTIEQQLVRVLTCDYRFCFQRKIKEIYLATKLKYIADKYTLAAAYLDMANYGTDYRNLSLILDKFEAKLSQDLDSTICAEIVARLKYPEPRGKNPIRMAQIERRKEHILQLYENKK